MRNDNARFDAVLPLENGDIIVQWPQRISADELDDLLAWFEIMKRKIDRTVHQECNTSLEHGSPERQIQKSTD